MVLIYVPQKMHNAPYQCITFTLHKVNFFMYWGDTRRIFFFNLLFVITLSFVAILVTFISISNHLLIPSLFL
jgi:hypothetical protein